MTSRMREDEKNEKIIRGLLKLPANKRCINCNNLGPQYVCTNFWTFICTNCSGIHREFCHRVKSISMAKFTSQEVSALQEGGNERAKNIYFKEWDPQRHSVPDSSNIDRLREFIKHVYVGRRYSGERSTDGPSQTKPDDPNESRRGDSYHRDSRSPPYDDRFRERLGTTIRNDERNARFLNGERSPGYDQNQGKRNPRYFEVVDNRQRDDRFGNASKNRGSEDHKLPDVVTKPEGSSPDHQKDFSASSSPSVRPVRDILGADMPQLRVGDLPKSNGITVPKTPPKAQRTSSSSSMGSTDGISAQPKMVTEDSLIDFSTDPEPSVAAAAAATQPSVSQTTVPTPQPAVTKTTYSSSNTGDWASFDVVNQQNVSQAAAIASTLESSLAQLSAPGSTFTSNMSVLPISGGDSSLNTNNGGQWSTMPNHQPSLFPAADSRSPIPSPITPLGFPNNKPLPQNSQGHVSSSIVHPSQFTGKLPQETSAGVPSQLSSADTKPSVRKELPEDIFTAMYSSNPMSVSGWQRGPHPSMGHAMQYPMAATMPVFPQSSKSTNPFDLGSELAPSHVPTFPSLSPLQGALPNMAGPSPLMRSFSFGSPSPQGVPQQQSSYPLAFSPSSYLVPQIPSNLPQQTPNNIITMGHQGTGGSGSGAVFGNMGMNQLPAARYYSQPNTPNSFSSAGGNPFG